MSDCIDEKVKIDKMIRERLAMSDESPLAELFSLVACHLTGLKVYARLREPYKKDCRGIMLPCGNGRVTIDINPAQDLAGQYWTFLHETAHVRHHYHDINTESVLTEPGSVELDPAKYEKSSVIKQEKEADAQAEKWDAYASEPVRLREVGYPDNNPIEFYKLQVLSKIKIYDENGDEI